MPYCEICKISVERLSRHLDTQKHKKNEKEYNKEQKAINDLKDDILIDVSRVFIPYENENFEVQETNYKYNKKYKIAEADFKLNFKEARIDPDELEDVFEQLLLHLNIKDNDKYDIIIQHPEFNNPISTGLQKYDVTSPFESTSDTLANILTSNEHLDLRYATINVRVINIPNGQKGNIILNLPDSIVNKHSIIQIKNDDNYCLPRAVVVSLTYLIDNLSVQNIFKNIGLNDFSESKLKYIRDCRKPLQKQLAIELLKKCNIEEENFIGTLDNVKTIEAVLNIQISVVCAENFNTIIWKGINKEVMVYLLKVRNHFHVIKSMEAFYSSSYYCHTHKKKYNNLNECVKCKNDNHFCYLCGHLHKVETTDWVYCKKCNRNFKNQECFNNHNLNRKINHQYVILFGNVKIVRKIF
jgi:hypothetical protein